jgi:hypothetical protein
MKKFMVLVVDDITSSYEKAIAFLKSNRYDCLFLDLPTTTETAFQAVTCGTHWRDEVMGLMDRGLLREPEDTRLIRAAEPLFAYLQSSYIRVFCYREPFHYDLLRKIAGDVFALTGSSKIFGIKTGRWLSLIEDLVLTEQDIIERDSNYLIQKAEEENVVFGGEGLAGHLHHKGYEANTLVLDWTAKPLDLLKRVVAEALIEGKEVPTSAVEDLVSEHLNFVDLVIGSMSYDEACKLWKSKPRRL